MNTCNSASEFEHVYDILKYHLSRRLENNRHVFDKYIRIHTIHQTISHVLEKLLILSDLYEALTFALVMQVGQEAELRMSPHMIMILKLYIWKAHPAIRLMNAVFGRSASHG